MTVRPELLPSPPALWSCLINPRLDRLKIAFPLSAERQARKIYITPSSTVLGVSGPEVRAAPSFSSLRVRVKRRSENWHYDY